MGYSKRYFGLKPSKEFGAYLRGLREQNTKLSQVEAAGRVSLSREALNAFEQGSRTPRETILIKLAQLYHVYPDEILRKAYWPQLLLLPLVSIIEPEKLPDNLIEELQKGLEMKERQKLTSYIEKLLCRRAVLK